MVDFFRFEKRSSGQLNRIKKDEFRAVIRRWKNTSIYLCVLPEIGIESQYNRLCVDETGTFGFVEYKTWLGQSMKTARRGTPIARIFENMMAKKGWPIFVQSGRFEELKAQFIYPKSKIV